jgi:hypothetical protein
MTKFSLNFLPALAVALIAFVAPLHSAPTPDKSWDFMDRNCMNCHDDVRSEGDLDLTTLEFKPADPRNFSLWVKVHDRLLAGEMPPKSKPRPEAKETTVFASDLAASLTAYEKDNVVREGRATQRRLNGYEYENSLRDLFAAPWLQIRGQFPDDGEAFRFNKIGDALDVSHVHMTRYMTAADYALRQVLSVQLERPPTATKRYYARDQRTLTSKLTGTIFNNSPDRMTYPVVGLNTPQPDVRWLRAPLSDPKTRDEEAVAWVASNYVTGFTYRWDQFRAPVAGRYRIRFSGYTLWVPPGGIQMSFKNEQDKVGKARPPNKNAGDYDHPQPGSTEEPITVYTRNGVLNRRVGAFDLTPTPGVYDIGEVWLLANETLVPDASRFYRSRPPNFHNPLMKPEGAPSVAFRWMEVDGPLYDDATTAGYRLLFGDLPLKKLAHGASGGVTVPVVERGEQHESGHDAAPRVPTLTEIAVEVASTAPRQDAERLLRGFLAHAYRRPVEENDVQLFLGLIQQQLDTGHSFTEAMLSGYTAVLASPGFVFLDEQPGRLDDYALATRLALFLWNSAPDDALRARAARGELQRPEILRAETDRLLADPKARRFTEAFLDYWIDLRKIEDSTPSTTLYNDYYLDDALAEAALAETQLFFADLVQRDAPVRNLVDSDYTFLNERLAEHYGVPGVKGIAMRRVALPPSSPRGGIMTQASVLKVTANGTTTSPVLRGKWFVERILGLEIPPPPPTAGAIEPDIRGAVTIRQQLDKHRADPSCASCHVKMDPAGFALESFDVMGGWRDRYRGVDEKIPGVPGTGKNGHTFEFHFGLPVDSSGQLPDGRAYRDIREFKQLLRREDVALARNLAKQFVVYATGAPVRFSDRPQIERILQNLQAHNYGVRSIIHEIVQSDLFTEK